MVNNVLANAYILYLTEKYQSIVKNKWVHWVVIGFIVLAFIAYAWYCTSRGYNFSGQVRFRWPTFGQIGIGCSR